MAARTRRGSGSTAGTKENGSKDDWLEKRVDAVREVTNAAEEDIRIILAECDGDVDEATSRLIDNPFSEVKNKKQKAKAREEDRKKEGSKVIEVRRPPGQGRGRGERTGRQSDRGNERAHDRGRSGSRTLPPVSASKPQENGTVGSEVSGDWDQPSVEEDKPVAPPSIPRPTYSRAPGPASASSDHVHSETVRPPITAAGGGGPTMADLFKKPPPSPTPPPAAIAPPTSSLQPQKHLLDEPTPQTDLSALGGRAVSPPPKPIRPPPSAIAPTASSLSAAAPTATLPLSSISPQDAQVQAPSTQASKGLSSIAPSRFPGDGPAASASTSAWGPPPKPAPSVPVSVPPPAPSPTQASLLGSSAGASLGSSLLSSLQAAQQSAPGPTTGSDPLRLSSAMDLPVPSPSSASGQIGLDHLPREIELSRSQPRASSSLGNASNDLNFQFGQFGLGGTGAPGFNSVFDPSARNPLLQDQALAAASPSIHSLGGSVSSAAAAQFSKAAGTPADFHSAGPAQPPRQTFAPGFPPPAQQHPQHAQQDPQQSQQSVQQAAGPQPGGVRPGGQPQQPQQQQRYGSSLPPTQSQGSQTLPSTVQKLGAPGAPPGQQQANGNAALLSGAMRGAQQPVGSLKEVEAAARQQLPYKHPDQAYTSPSDFAGLQYGGSAQQQQQAQHAGSISISQPAAGNPYAGGVDAGTAAAAPSASSAPKASAFDLGTPYQGVYGNQPAQREFQQATAGKYGSQAATQPQTAPAGSAAATSTAQSTQSATSAGLQQHTAVPQMSGYGANVPPGMGQYAAPYGYGQPQGMYAPPHQMHAQQYFNPAAAAGYGYGVAGYGNPQGYSNPGMGGYGSSNAYSGVHAGGGGTPHGKFGNYANQGYLGNGYDDSTGGGAGLGGYNAGHHAGGMGPGAKGADLPAHGLHTPQHMPGHALYPHQQHAAYPNVPRDGYYDHGGYQANSQAFDRRNFSHGHYPGGAAYKAS